VKTLLTAFAFSKTEKIILQESYGSLIHQSITLQMKEIEGNKRTVIILCCRLKINL